MSKKTKIYKTKSKNINVLITYLEKIGHHRFDGFPRNEKDIKKFENKGYIYIYLWDDNDFSIERGFWYR